MNHDKLIQSIRACNGKAGEACADCVIGYKHGCVGALKRAAADMLEQDSEKLSVCYENAEQVLANLKEINAMLDEVKSADEMFRELGYEKEPCISEWLGRYTRGSDCICVSGLLVWSEKNGKPRAFALPELRAVCKLLDEMGVE